MPADPKSIVASDFSPLPDVLTTVPNPNLLCVTRSPGCEGHHWALAHLAITQTHRGAPHRTC